MCGIIGYVGRREAAPILVEGLHRLEYRGYDSAGVAVQNGAGVMVAKLAGRVGALGTLLRGARSEERRVGEECRGRGWRGERKEKSETGGQARLRWGDIAWSAT